MRSVRREEGSLVSGIEAGIPLWDGLGPHHSGDGRDYFGVMHYRDTPHAEDRRDPTHRAYPADYARTLEAVAEATRVYLAGLNLDFETLYSTKPAFYELWKRSAALDALAAAGQEASDG